MPRGLKLSHPLITNLMLLVNISKFFKFFLIFFNLHYDICIAHSNTWDDSFVF